MRHPNRRSFAIGRIVAVLVLALALATPASAQFGALKKKLKGDAAAKAAEKAVGGDASAAAPTDKGAAASAAAPAGQTGGAVVMSPEMVDRLMKGLKAGKAEREKAETEDTPYGRYLKARTKYDVAKAKCDAAQQTWPNRLMADQKLMAKSQHFLDKVTASSQDTVAMRIYGDSMLGMVDPSCLVKSPEQPNDYWDMQRAVDDRAQDATNKAADFSSSRDFGYASDRAIAILTGQAPDASASEKSAVGAKDAELKSMLGISSAQEEKVSRQPKAAVVETVQPAPAPAPAAPAIPPGAAAMNDCQIKNFQAHQAEIEALGDRGSAAEKAHNTALMMAIADTIRSIQYAGCTRAR